MVENQLIDWFSNSRSMNELNFESLKSWISIEENHYPLNNLVLQLEIRDFLDLHGSPIYDHDKKSWISKVDNQLLHD